MHFIVTVLGLNASQKPAVITEDFHIFSEVSLENIHTLSQAGFLTYNTFIVIDHRCFFVFGATAPSGPRSPLSRGF
jgi:hypothetical protein